MTFLRNFLIGFFAVLFLAAAFAAGYLVRELMVQEPSFHLLDEAYQYLIDNSLTPPPTPPSLEYGMIRGMVGAYQDPYTTFVEPVQHELQSDALHGSFGGIGAQLGRDEEGFHVLFPFQDSPASRSGIQEGDRLLAVEDFPITPDSSVEDIQSAIRGPVSEKVKLKIAREPDYREIIISVERAEIPLPSVTWHIDVVALDTGIIKVNLIAASTPDEIITAIEDMKSREANKFVLDLRDNPGGLLTAGVDIARLFLESGIVMKQEFRERETEVYEVQQPGQFIDLPIIVLINQNSASAAEITAGALQGHSRSKLVGVPSFGKDTVQYVFVLSDNSSLHVTAARWWIPSLGPDVKILQPDILVEPSEEATVDEILRTAVNELQKQ